MLRRSARYALALLGLAIASQAFAAGEDPVVGTVNGAEIRMSDVVRIKNADPRLAQAPLKAVYPMLLDNLIREQLLAEAGRKDNLGKDPEVQLAMKNAETRIIAQTYALRQTIKQVTDQQAQSRYNELKKEYKPVEEIRARHILVASYDDANALLADLKAGKKFEELAAEKSKDPGAQNGGDLGFFRKDDMVPEFSDVAFKLKPGQVSQPVQTQFGWHVIKVEEKRMSKAPDFDQVKDDIKGRLADEALSKLLQKLATSAKISRFDPDGQPLPSPAPPKK